MKQEAKRIRKRTLIPLAGVLLVLAAVAVAGFYWSERSRILEVARWDADAVESLFAHEIRDSTTLMNIALHTLFENKACERAMRSQDQETLRKIATPLFRDLQNAHGLTGMSFSGPEHKIILELDGSNVFDESDEDSTARRAERLKQSSSSLEIKKTTGELALRTVIPWFEAEQPIGYLELDQDIDTIAKHVHAILGVEVLLLLDKSLLNRATWEKHVRAAELTTHWNQLPTLVVAHQTLPSFPLEISTKLTELFAAHPTTPQERFDISLAGQHYLGGTHPLLSAGGKHLGEIIYLRNLSQELNTLDTTATAVAIAFLCFGGALFAFFYFYTGLVGKQQLAAAEVMELQSLAQEASAVAIGIADREGMLQYANPAFAKLTGHNREGLIGMDIKMINAQDPISGPQRKGWEKTTRGNAWSGRIRLFQKDGSPRDVDLTMSPVRDNNTGEVKHLVVVGQDITEQLALEQRLQQTQKMEAVGQLAGGVAHDFNNVLMGILGYAELLKNAERDEEVIDEAAAEIWAGAKRAADLTKQLLGFARRGKNRSVPVDIHEIMPGVIRLIDPILDKRIGILTRLEASSSIVAGDPSQLEQVILNLVLNAIDAIAAQNAGGKDQNLRGQITLATRSVSRPPEPGSEAEDFLEISVTDNGCGMTEDVQERIFEPFFTTKEVGRGTGMGLAMVYGIVKNHGGWIDIESSPGSGTTFTITLPLADAMSLQSEETSEPALIHGTGQILVVDDEDVIRKLLSKTLSSLGYIVFTARNGSEALKFFNQRKDSIDLVVLDMIMPEMSGTECLRELKKIDPSLRVIITTGYGRDGAAQELMDGSAVGFIQKPFSSAKLSNEVARVLALAR